MREPAITDYRALTWPCRRLAMWSSRASPATKYGYRPTQPIGNSRTLVLQSIDPNDLPDFRNVIRSAFRVAGQADSNVRTARGPAGSTRRGANEAELFVGGVRVEQMRVTPDAVGHALESVYFVCGPGSPFERRDPAVGLVTPDSEVVPPFDGKAGSAPRRFVGGLCKCERKRHHFGTRIEFRQFRSRTDTQFDAITFRQPLKRAVRARRRGLPQRRLNQSAVFVNLLIDRLQEWLQEREKQPLALGNVGDGLEFGRWRCRGGSGRGSGSGVPQLSRARSVRAPRQGFSVGLCVTCMSVISAVVHLGRPDSPAMGDVGIPGRVE